MDWTGEVKVERCLGRSVATRAFGRYPLKLILPSKVAASGTDAVWVYALTYGGGIVSGDSIACRIDVTEGCTMVWTTQASTKIYKAIGEKCSEQILEATVGRNATLMVLPDPVTCFASARFRQLQTFSLAQDSNLVLIDWLTSGRRERGEVWSFDYYKSTNNIYVDNEPVFLDTVIFEQQGVEPVGNRLKGYHSVAMLVLYGPSLAALRKELQQSVLSSGKDSAKKRRVRKGLLCSCSPFGPSDQGLVVRLVADDTEAVYQFFHQHLDALALIVGAPLYHGFPES